MMQELGLEISDLTGSPAKAGRARRAKAATAKAPGRKAASKVPPKYRDTETGTTWTGRGRTPLWLAAHIKAGGAKEDFLIPT